MTDTAVEALVARLQELHAMASDLTLPMTDRASALSDIGHAVPEIVQAISALEGVGVLASPVEGGGEERGSLDEIQKLYGRVKWEHFLPALQRHLFAPPPAPADEKGEPFGYAITPHPDYPGACIATPSLPRLQWTGRFSVRDPDPTDDHGPIYLVCPGGLLVNFSCDPTPGLDVARVEWVAATLNKALAPPVSLSERERVISAVMDALESATSEFNDESLDDLASWAADAILKLSGDGE